MLRFALVVLAFLCSLQTSLRADVTGTILGIARDSTSAAMPNVKVTVSNIATNFSRSAVTDATGEYRFTSLPAGTYTVEAELNGFQRFVAAGITLSVTSSAAWTSPWR